MDTSIHLQEAHEDENRVRDQEDACEFGYFNENMDELLLE
jgi:hypothetical protein